MSVRLSPDRKWNECCNQIIRHIALCRREHILELNVKFGTPPSPFECPFGGCGKRFSSQSELISHMDKESAEAREAATSGRWLLIRQVVLSPFDF